MSEVSRLLSILVLTLMLVSIIVLPVPGRTSPEVGDTGVYLKAGFPDNALNWTGKPWNETTEEFYPVIVTDDGTVRIYIDKNIVPWPLIRISFVFPENITAPSTGGVFLPIGYNNTFSSTNPDYFGSAVIDLTKPTNWSDTPSHGLYVNNTNVSNIVLVAIRFNKTLLDLSNATFIQNVYHGASSERFQVNLYNKKLYVKIFNAVEWDARLSSNTLTIIETLCSDVMINVYGSPAMYSSDVNITVSLERFFKKIEDLTGISMDIDYNETYLYMINYYNLSEYYLLINITNSTTEVGGQPIPFTYAEYLKLNRSTFKYIGHGIADYAPSKEDPDTPYLSALYTFNVYYEYSNDTVDIVIDVVSGNKTAPCVYSETTPFLRINASLFVIPTDFAGDYGEINPDDLIEFHAHNVPADYLDSVYMIYRFNLTNTTYDYNFSLTTNWIIYFAWADGVIDGLVYLPELPYAGLYYQCYLVFDNYKWITNSTYLVKIEPYTHIYVLTETSAYTEDADGYYIGEFIYSYTPEAAPGDYIVIEGHGFNLTDLSNIKVNVFGVANATILNISTNIPTLTNTSGGYFLMLVKLIDEDTAGIIPTTYGHGYIVTGTPISPGSGNLTIGTLDTPNIDVKPFTITTGDPYKKVLFNPDWILNETGYYINHTKLGDPYTYFIVEYELLPYPGAENDEFVESYWKNRTWMEIIGWTTTPFELKLYNKEFDIVFEWLTIYLMDGYALVDLYNATIPFLPYGDYTLLEETLASVNNRTVFTVHMGIDVDVSWCRNGTFNVTIVGGAPNTEYNLTFYYQVYELIYGKHRYVKPHWTNEFNITVITDSYGYGFTSKNLTDIYNTSMVTNVTWDMIVLLKLNGTGTLDLWFLMNGSLITFYDNSTTPIAYLLGPSDLDYETNFYVNATYNVTVTRVAVYHLNATSVTISVTHTALPGDKITVQIFPHNGTSTLNLLVIPSALFEEPKLIGWYLDVRLVDPYAKPYGTSAIIDRVVGYYAGKLIVGDVDEDGINEIWFTVNLTAPLVLGEDKTYRVDVKLFLAILEPETNVTGLEVYDYGCRVNMSINGTIYWRGYGTHLLLGSDMQTVDVLGIVYAKLEEIVNNTVVLEAKIDDLTTYIKVNITELLREINNTVVKIHNDTMIIKDGVARLEIKMDELFNIMDELKRNVTILLACCNDVYDLLNDTYNLLNETYTYVLKIDGNVEQVIDLINYEVIPKFYELYDNVSILINISREWIIENITAINRSITNLIITSKSEIESTLQTILNTMTTKFDELYENITTNITITVNDVGAEIIGVVRNESNRLELLINLTRDTLNDTIITIYNALSTKVDNAKSEIISRINSTKLYLEALIVNKTLRLETLINLTNTTIISTLNTSIYNIYTKLIDNITRCCNNLSNMIQDLKLYVNDTTTWIIMNITDMNRTIHYHLDVMTKEIGRNYTQLVMYIAQEFNETFNRLDEIEANITYYINATRQYLEGVIYDVRDDVLTNLTITLDDIKTDLTTLINTRVDKLEMMINDNVTTILATIRNVNLTIVNMLNELNITIYNRTAWIMAGLISMNTSLHEILEELVDNINYTRTTIITCINNTKMSLTTLMLNINDTLTMYLNGEFKTLKDILADLRENMTNEFNAMDQTLDKLSSDLTSMMNNMNKTLVDILTSKLDTTINIVSTKLDDTKSTVEDKLKATSELLSSKVDTASKKLEDAVSSVNSNLTIFGAAILLLEIIILALSSFILYKRPAG